MKIFFITMLSFLLSGCAAKGPASVAGGECKIFNRPSHVILGQTQFDQDWIDDTVEGGVGGCRWARPAPRSELKQTVVNGRAVATPPPAAKKPGVFRRAKAKIKAVVLPRPAVAAPAVVVPVWPVAVPEKPRVIDPVDELLNPGR